MAGNPHKAETSIAMDSTDAIIVDILEHDGRATLTRLAKASGFVCFCSSISSAKA